MKLTAVIADDEKYGREVVAKLLSVYCPEVEVKGQASTVDEAVRMVNDYHPDILFMDIRMGETFGFDILPSLKKPIPFIVAVTAHQEYAIKALRAQVFDYLLKPIVSDDLKNAIRKIVDRKLNGQFQIEISNGISSLTAATEGKITIPSSEGLIFIKTSDIIRCQASGAYTEIFLKEGNKIITSINLGEFEKLLPEQWGFLRVHHSSMINLSEVTMYVKAKGGSVVMSDKSKVPIAQRKKGIFLEALRKYIRN